VPNFISFAASIGELAYGEKSHTHSPNHSPSPNSFDASESEALASEQTPPTAGNTPDSRNAINFLKDHSFS